METIKMNMLISVIIPVYKTEKYINRCLESVTNQTYRNLEIIIVDDASPDNCPEICDEWAKKDSRIIVLHTENKGVANARNTALKIASGDFIGFVDSDDYIEPDMYEQLINTLLNNNADVAVCNYQINDEKRGEDKISILTSNDALKLIVQGDYKYGVLWNKIYKKEVVQGIEMPHLRCSQDLPYNYFAIKNAKTVVENSLKLYHYFQNESSTMHSSFNESKYDAVKSRKIILEDVKKGDLYPYAVKGYVLSCFVFIDGIILNNKCQEFYSSVRKELLKYRKVILLSSHFNLKDKMKIIIFCIFPHFYNALIKKIRRKEGTCDE